VKELRTSPISNTELKPFLSCKDYTVSYKKFTLLIDEEAALLVTSPRPKDDELASYYDSEDYISHTDAKKTFIDKLYQWVKHYSLKKKLKLINSLVTNQKSLLDVGAGTGDFLSICNTGGWQVTGIEPNEKARNIAIDKLHVSTAVIYKNIEELTQNATPNTYDVISLWHVLEHIPNLTAYITNLKKLLKPQGTLIVAVPNYKSYDAAYYKEYWAAYDVPRHLWHFSRKAIKKLFQQQNMKVAKIVPMKFDSFYVSVLSEKYKTGSSNYFRAFYIGWRSNIKAMANKEYSSLIYIIKNG